MHYMVLLMVAAIACGGPGAGQVRIAKGAEYKAPAATIFELAKAVATETYKLGQETPSKHTFVTAPQFYNKDGGRQSAGAGDVVTVTVGSVQLRLHVQIADAGPSRVTVTVTPHVLQLVAGSPKPRELAPGDPNMPTWVTGRADALAVAIYEKAKPYIEKP